MKSVLPLKIVIPLVLGIVASLAIAVYAELGFRRLEAANRQMAVALEMEATLHETLALIVNAETGQRGYLLTGNEEYLQPYKPRCRSSTMRSTGWANFWSPTERPSSATTSGG